MSSAPVVCPHPPFPALAAVRPCGGAWHSARIRHETAYEGVWYAFSLAADAPRRLNTPRIAVDGVAIGDFNGDGVSDVFRTDGERCLVSYSGNGKWTAINRSGMPLRGLRFGDFNGDGKTDVFRVSKDGWRVSSAGTTKWETVNSVTGISVSDLLVADMNGDGRDDIVVTKNGVIRLSLGARGRLHQITGGLHKQARYKAGDSDGDGAD